MLQCFVSSVAVRTKAGLAIEFSILHVRVPQFMAELRQAYVVLSWVGE
jgi:hypothetical protein